MEENKVERPLMSEKEFTDYVKKVTKNPVEEFEKGILHLNTFEAVNKFKSIRRAIKRGHISLDGIIYPKRPFNNAKHHIKSLNNTKKLIYGQIKQRRTSKVTEV